MLSENPNRLYLPATHFYIYQAFILLFHKALRPPSLFLSICLSTISVVPHPVFLISGRGRGGITARLRFKAPWLENCVRHDCDISHSE